MKSLRVQMSRNSSSNKKKNKKKIKKIKNNGDSDYHVPAVCLWI